MKNLRTKTRIILAASLLTVFFTVLNQFRFNFNLLDLGGFGLLKPLLLSILAYILCLWVLHFNLKGERYVSIALFPVLGVFVFTFITSIISDNIINFIGSFGLLLLSSLLFWGFTYILFATVNILNVAIVSEIPLGQAARAAQFVLTLIIAYVLYVIIYSNDVNMIIRAIFLFTITFLLNFIALASIKVPKRKRTLLAATIGILIVFAGFILSLWPVSAPYQALALSLVLYINLGIALETKEKIDQIIWVEYSALYLIILIFLVLIAEWGINGHIF